MKELFPSDIGYKLTSESRFFDPLKMAEVRGLMFDV